jgi:hypothetical protein
MAEPALALPKSTASTPYDEGAMPVRLSHSTGA